MVWHPFDTTHSGFGLKFAAARSGLRRHDMRVIVAHLRVCLRQKIETGEEIDGCTMFSFVRRRLPSACLDELTPGRVEKRR